jgi:uncharacterized protein (TIGR03437 family)
MTRQGLAVFFLTLRLCAQSVSFIAHSDLPLGFKPTSVVVGDFNGDGKPDLAVSSYSPSSISVLLGKGDGSFQAPLGLDAGRTYLCLATGDFNGDGKLDLAAVALNSSNISVLLGKGDGTFQPVLNFPVGQGPFAIADVSVDAFIAVGDLNGDGKPDLIVGNQGANDVAVLLGNGDGSFKAATSFPVAGAPQSMALGDFNGDGRLDLAVATSGPDGVFPLPGEDGVSMLLGKGDGSFQPAVNFAAGRYPASLVVSDFNGDGKPDLAVANYDSNDVTVLLGKGDGMFQPAVSFAVGQSPDSVRVGDFNGDGRPDLAVANYDSSNNISILLGKGDGTFQSALNLANGGCCVANTDSIAVGDFNGDGKLDLALANKSAENLSIWLGNGDGSFMVGGTSIKAVVSASAFGEFSSIAPGTFIEIYGSNLSSTSPGRIWSGSDFTNNGRTAPTSLDGTQVTVGGQPAYVYYISPGQVNALVPSTIGTGLYEMTVTSPSGASNSYAVNMNAVEPGLLASPSFIVGGKQYVEALFSDGKTFVLPVGAISGPLSRPAKPGETIVIYGIGFGPVNPTFDAGTVVSQANSLTMPLQILFGNVPAQLPYDGLAPGFTGLYQFDVVIPPIPDSDAVPLTFNLGGTAGTQILYIAVHH